MKHRPLYVYDNWSTYDELSDNVLLTEELAMRQFEEALRLRRQGVKIDAYLMDAFWYEPNGAYETWRHDRWPNGPEDWLEACKREGILPGLWFPANTAFTLTSPEGWRDSLAANDYGFCCFEGGFLAGFIGVLSKWYKRGIRVFKFDFADFGAIPARQAPKLDDRAKNIAAYRTGLAQFKKNHPDAVLLAYNGFEDKEYMPWTDRPIEPVFDRAWMGSFDTVYCGDPRPAGTPLPNFWRTLDVYADAQVFRLHRGGLQLQDIDNCAFMIGNCGTCYRRGNTYWKTTALLSYARGGRVHVMMGNLEALSESDARWLVQVQALYETAGTPTWVGGNPGQGDLYGYAAPGAVTVVNPTLRLKSLTVGAGYQLAYSDGFVDWDGNRITLGAGAVALLSSGNHQLGTEPSQFGELSEIRVAWSESKSSAEGTIDVQQEGRIHLVFSQFDSDGLRVNTSGGAPPSGTSMAKLLRISASANGEPLEVLRPDDKVAWSGLSWAYGVVSHDDGPITVWFETDDPAVAKVSAAAYFEHV